MVNLRKVGAIATGALFVGSTLGMATAVNVPSDFMASMLADSGEAKAQLVVGKDAPGKTADEASAKIIQDKAETALADTVAGGDIELEYSHYRWDDTGSGTRANLTWQLGQTCPHTPDAGSGCFAGTKWRVIGKTYTTSTQTGNITNVNKGSNGYLRIDSNADGDFKDAGDYNIYSGLYVIDGTSGTLQPVYNFSTDRDATYSPKSNSTTSWYTRGVTFKVKGTRYTFAKETAAQEIVLAPTIRSSMAGVTQDYLSSATTLDGTKKIAFRKADGVTHALYFYDGTDFLGSVDINASGSYDTGDNATGGLIKNAELPSAMQDYRIWVKESGATAYVWAVRKDDEFNVVDQQADVLGYSEVRVNDTGFTPGGNGLYFLDDTFDLILGGTVDLPGTEYNVKWTTAKVIQLTRPKITTIASGTKMKTTDSAYSDIVDVDTTGTLTGEETTEPVLEIVDEDTASSTMNHVLIGGPVANSLVADLVTMKKSAVSWDTSDGDIEVVSDQPAEGYDSIIVAGKTRTETAAAADALAAAL